VVALAFRFGTVPRSSIVRVQLRSRFDLYLTLTAELVSLVPGTIVLEVHRTTGTLYLHILGATDDAAIEEAVAAVYEAEARVLRTFGSAAELAALQADRPQPDHDDVVREVS
jgi:multicomponent Na+:H+ antiporter subunit E